MNKYTCVLCGSNNYGYGNNPEPLDYAHNKCCNKCDIILVVSARLLNHTSIEQHLDFIAAMKKELPSDIKSHVAKVEDFMNYGHEYDTDDMWSYDLEPEKPYQDEMTFGEIYLNVKKAYYNALNNEYYESIPFLLKRLKELEKDVPYK